MAHPIDATIPAQSAQALRVRLASVVAAFIFGRFRGSFFLLRGWMVFVLQFDCKWWFSPKSTFLGEITLAMQLQ